MDQVNKGNGIKKSVCVWCKGECGVLVHVKDGHMVKLEEDPEWARKVWPATRGCVRFRAAKEYFYHPDRVNFPLKRVGEKGEGKWQQITWDQALDEIAEKMQKIGDDHGWEAIAWTSGTSNRTTEHALAMRFFNCIGSPNNIMQGQICYFPRSRVAEAIAGYFPHYSVRPETKCIVFFGMEPMVVRPITAHAIREARRRGAKVIVIDPRRTHSAETADVWLQLCPGTDVALLMGMINVIIKEELYDKEFVDKWCHGFDKLTERAHEYSLEKVTKITRVPVEKIREAARIYAANRPGCFIEGMGVEHLQQVAQALHARWIMSGLTANVDIQGGDEQVGPHPTIRILSEIMPRVPLSSGQTEKQIGSDRFRLFSWEASQMITENMQRVWGKRGSQRFVAHGPMVYRTILSSQPYPVRGMITVGSNPMITQPNIKLVYKALKSLDLYVVMDFFKTPSAALADYILPAACWLERPILWDFSGYSNYFIAGEAALPKVIPGEYEHKLDYDVWRELAIRLGKGEYFPWQTLEKFYDYLLEDTGLNHNEYVYQRRCELKTQKYKKYKERGFATPTGKVELYSTVFEKLGYDPLPAYQEPAETPISAPELAKKYPLRLITGGRVREYYHSEWRQIDSIRKLRPDPIVQINPSTATKQGISNGDWVWIETVRGRVKQKAELFDGISPDVVHCEHGWWFPELPGEEPWLYGVWESNINVVLNDDPEVCNNITGGWPLKTALCKIYKVKKY